MRCNAQFFEQLNCSFLLLRTKPVSGNSDCCSMRRKYFCDQFAALLGQFGIEATAIFLAGYPLYQSLLFQLIDDIGNTSCGEQYLLGDFAQPQRAFMMEHFQYAELTDAQTVTKDIASRMFCNAVEAAVENDEKP